MEEEISSLVQSLLNSVPFYKKGIYNETGKYPVHIGTYGWVSAESCGLSKSTNSQIAVGKFVIFDGTVRCHESSNGGNVGILPNPGKYIVTHYNPGAKYAVHIGTTGWVPESHCELI